MDLDMFKQKKQRCKGIAKCSFLQRIATSMRYNELLVSCNKIEIFTNFVMETYGSALLDDYIHLICVHARDIAQVAEYFTSEYGFEKSCAVANCSWTQKHLIGDTSHDDYNFYLRTFDALHFYIFHLETLGYRQFDAYSFPSAARSHKNDTNDYSGYFTDDIFQNAMCDIRQKQSQYASLTSAVRWHRRCKFNLLCSKNQNETTFISAMISTLQREQTCEPVTLNALTLFLESEDYDTDGVIDDVELYAQSNISSVVHGDTSCMDRISKLIKEHKTWSGHYANECHVGVTFWYWSLYKTNTSAQHFAAETFAEYSVQQFYVEPHFTSLKEEVLGGCNNNILSVQQFNQLLIDKADKYSRCRKCRKLKTIMTDDPYNFEIANGATIQITHLHALILYCDFIAFYQPFVSTFFKHHWNESLASLKQRHSQFYHCAKYLRECVQYFGNQFVSHARHQHHSQQHRTFFVGVPRVTHIPSSSVYLNAPTSVSKHAEVAMRYAHDDGMMLQLCPLNDECMFNCAWISRYAEEDEHIFFASSNTVRVCSVFTFSAFCNYRVFISALHKFEVLLHGDYEPMNDHDVQVIVSLMQVIEQRITRSSPQTALAPMAPNDLFVLKTFDMFRRNVLQISLNAFRIDQYVQNKALIDSLMFDLQQYSYNFYETGDELNVFKLVLFEIFPNVEEIVLWTTSYKGDLVYSFDLHLFVVRLLQCPVLPLCLKKIILKARKYTTDHRQFRMPGANTKMASDKLSWLEIEHETLASDSKELKIRTHFERAPHFDALDSLTIYLH